MGAVEAVIAVSTHAWTQPLIRWIVDHSDDVRLIDHQVFEAHQALEYNYDCLVVDIDSSLLDRALVDELHQRGRSIIVVTDLTTAEPPALVDELGVDRVVDRHRDPGQIATVIAEVARTRADFAEVVNGLDVPEVPQPADGTPTSPMASWVTVITGALEGVGATEVLVETAVALRRRGEPVCVIDADLIAASLAQRLGLGYQQHLQTAIDAVVHGSGLLADALQHSPVGDLDVIVGVEAAKWAEVEPRDAVKVVEAARHRGGHVLVAVGSQLEELVDERHDVARALLGHADQVIAVCDSTPTGVTRLCRWLVAAGELTHLARIHATFNRSLSTAAGEELEHELLRTAAGIGGVSHLPTDPKVPWAAWRGEAVARGRFTRAVSRLVGHVPTTSQQTPQRRRRLQVGGKR